MILLFNLVSVVKCLITKATLGGVFRTQSNISITDVRLGFKFTSTSIDTH